MDYRHLGNSGLKVSALTLGAMAWGGEGPFSAIGSVGVAEAQRQLDMAMDAGVNIIDTADIYSFGKSEEILGEVAHDRRNRLLLATKVRSATGAGPNDGGLSRHHLMAACDASLRRLRTDHIDLYQLHGWDGSTPVDETLRALEDMVRAGKVRYIGVSNFSGWHLMKALHVAAVQDCSRVVSHQIHYSALVRDAEWELLPIAVDQGVGCMVWSPLASGLLSGKYRRDRPEPAGTRIAAWPVPPRPDPEHLYAVVDALVAIAEERGDSVAQVALAWLLTRPGVSTLIVGARTDAQLSDNLNAAGVQLAQDEIDRIEQASRRPLPYPMWQQAAIYPDRLSPADMAALGPHLA